MYYFYLATHVLNLDADIYFSMSLRQFLDYLEIHQDYQREISSNTTSEDKNITKTQPKVKIKNLGNFLRGGV